MRLRIEAVDDPGVEVGALDLWLDGEVTATGLGRTLYGVSFPNRGTSDVLDQRDGAPWLRAMEVFVNSDPLGAWLGTLEGQGETGIPELIREYVRLRRELKARGVLRADRSLAGELAEYLAARDFGVSLQPNLVNAGFDGIRDGKRIQVKARIIRSVDASTSWDFREAPAGFDEFLGFLFDPDYRVLRIVRLPVDVVQRLAVRNKSRWSLRWNKALRRRIGMDLVRAVSGATIADFRCSICGSLVGYQELYPAGVPRGPGRDPEHPRRRMDRPWIYQDNGDRMGDSELSGAEFRRRTKALRGDRPESFLSLYCEECELVYCFDHWEVEYATQEPLSTYGTCPHNHSRVIDIG